MATCSIPARWDRLLNFCPSHAGAKMQTNLASSSRKHSLRNSGINRSIRRRRRPPYIIRSLDPLPQCPRPSGLGSFFAAPDLNHLNAARTSAAAEGSTEANLNFCHSHAGAKMQPNLAGSLIDALKYSHPQTGGRYFFSQTSLLMLIRYRSFL